MRKILRRGFFFILALLIAVQAPFIYRRYEIARLGERIAQSANTRRAAPSPGFQEIKGIIHSHTSLGGHSTGTFDEIIKVANAEGLDFVVLTEHYSTEYDTSALTLNGFYGKTLFVGGQEADANDGGRYLLIPGNAETPQYAKMTSAEMLQRVHSQGRIAINNYPDRSRAKDPEFDGMEVYSLHINAKRSNPFTAIPDLIWSFQSYPEWTFATYFRRNDDYLRRFDTAAQRRKIFLTAGADAHSNIGFYLFSDAQGKHILGKKFDPYSMVFRLMRMHYLIPEGIGLNRESLISAIKAGNGFVGFDILGDTTGFRFTAENETGSTIMGGEIRLGNGVKLSAAAPLATRFVLIHNGEKIAESASEYEFSTLVSQPGVYRIEAYLDSLGPPFDQTPWIISNPVYVR